VTKLLRNERDRFALLILAVFLIIWGLLAIQPPYRSDWLLESILVFVAIPLLLALHPNLPLSKVSYSLIFVSCACIRSLRTIPMQRCLTIGGSNQ